MRELTSEEIEDVNGGNILVGAGVVAGLALVFYGAGMYAGYKSYIN